MLWDIRSQDYEVAALFVWLLVTKVGIDYDLKAQWLEPFDIRAALFDVDGRL